MFWQQSKRNVAHINRDGKITVIVDILINICLWVKGITNIPLTFTTLGRGINKRFVLRA